MVMVRVKAVWLRAQLQVSALSRYRAHKSRREGGIKAAEIPAIDPAFIKTALARRRTDLEFADE
jgi:hypothetical protein